MKLLAVILALAATSYAQTVSDNPYITLEVKDATNFCTFLPPADSVDRNIASTEYIANVYCMGSTPQAKAVGKLADGFIQSAHFLATDSYVQVTGQIDPVKGNLNATDEGGQYDIVMPKGAVCVGWKHFVNLIEPAGNTYCIRCCHSKVDCNRGISEKGCAHIVPGDYTGPLDNSGAGIPAPSNGGAVPAASSSVPATASVRPTTAGSSSAASSASSSASPSSKDDSVTAQSVDDESSSTMTRPTIALTAFAGLLLAVIYH
ncbi:hypothetical protein BJV82DRAFT_599366 [Fennellomyces sp. T-0311]|nr:hypothetical protein BJV82DRAFT_599366 [Fennellomyces sp. T-0311]